MEFTLKSGILFLFHLSIYNFQFSFTNAQVQGANEEIATNQLPEWAANKSPNLSPFVSNKRGVNIPTLTSSQTVGPTGPALLKDTNLMELLSNLNHERIPERIVHAKGGGAHGYFKVTHDISQYTKASLFSSIGKTTPVFARFSTSLGEAGSADTLRDNRGMAIKFYTDEGIYNFAGFHIPAFQIRDPLFFPSLVHATKRNPRTHLRDFNMIWDFFSLRQESTFNILMTFADMGIPNGFRFFNGFGIHTFQLVNKQGQYYFCRFNWMNDQKGKNNLTQTEAFTLAATTPDYGIQDLYDAIGRHDYPKWTLYVQILTIEQAQNYRFNVFDVTKILPEKDFPMRPVGTLVLNRNPTNFHMEVESVAFCPGDLLPGIQMAEMDALLHARSFAYRDTQRYRLGSNFDQLKINRPINYDTKTTKESFSYERDGECNARNYDGGPNYYPNSFSAPSIDPNAVESPAVGLVKRTDTGDEDNFSLARDFLSQMSTGEMERMIVNLGNALSLAIKKIRDRQISNYEKVDPKFAKTLRAYVDKVVAFAASQGN